MGTKDILDITDEDILAVINRIHPTTKNTIVGRFGILEYKDDFRKSHKKYGSAYIDIERLSSDGFDDYWSFTSFTRIKIHGKPIWFEEYNSDMEAITYNKNHMFGYDKLRELGYKLPDEPQWT